MRNSILYYYDLETEEILFDGENYYFENYMLKKLQRLINYELYQLFINNNIYLYRIIFNKFNSYETNINGDVYILLLREKYIPLNFDLILSFSKKIDNYHKIYWNTLWEKKIDYFESAISFYSSNKCINNIFQYYIGLAENAIQYFNENNDNYTLHFSHYRIKSKNDFFCPDNLLIDSISRDFAEYIKYLFFDNVIKLDKIYNVLEKVSFTSDEYILLISRLLFPTYFFDYVEMKKDLFELQSKIYQYEKLLSDILSFVRKKVDIPSVEWITKKI